MNVCKTCNAKIIDDTTRCPLCKGVLASNDEQVRSGVTAEYRYPNVSRKLRVESILKRVLVFATLVASVICVYIDYTVETSLHFSIIVVGALVYALLMLFSFTNKREGYRKRTFGLCFYGFIYVVVIDWVTGYRGWSVNYILPSIYILLAIAMLVLMIVNNRNWQSYLILLLGLTVISGASLVLVRMGIITFTVLSVIAFFFCGFAFAGTLIFGGQEAQREMKRRFYI